jgi:hypothetical protein
VFQQFRQGIRGPPSSLEHVRGDAGALRTARVAGRAASQRDGASTLGPAQPEAMARIAALSTWRRRIRPNVAVPTAMRLEFEPAAPTIGVPVAVRDTTEMPGDLRRTTGAPDSYLDPAVVRGSG